MDVKEIFAEKIRTLNERARPRDLYDIIMLYKNCNIDIKECIDILKFKEMNKPINKDNINENYQIVYNQFENEMKELYYKIQIGKNDIKFIVDKIIQYIE